jgi:maltose O-acetyltransferase
MTPPRAAADLARRAFRAVHAEVSQFHPVLHALSLGSRIIPPQVGGNLRVSVLRAMGVEVGEGTVVYDTPEFTGGDYEGSAKMKIGNDCVIGVRCSFELGSAITIGDRVTIGHNVLIITTTHDLGPREHRAGPLVRNPVQIEDGAWIGPCAVILPGVTIGAGAIVDPGSVVNKNVLPNTRVRGTPAKQVEELAP